MDKKIVEQVKYYWNKYYGKQNGNEGKYQDVLFQQAKNAVATAISKYNEWYKKFTDPNTTDKTTMLKNEFFNDKYEVVMGDGGQANSHTQVATIELAVNDIDKLFVKMRDPEADIDNNIFKLDKVPSVARRIAVFESWCDTCVEKYKYRLWPIKDDPKKWYKDVCADGNASTWGEMGMEILSKLYTDLNIDVNLDNYLRLYMILWKLWNPNRFDDIDKYPQIVYTGAPGTGKTYGIREYVELACLCSPIDADYTSGRTQEKIKQWKFVQFHSSYDYSDFVEGLRPICLGNKNEPTFVRMDGVFKAFCRDVAEYNKSKFDTWKKEEKNNKKLKLIEGEKVGSPNYWNHLNEWEEWGKMPKFYFVIDEINRADLGKVFGELMFALEEGYRDKPFDTQYMNLPTYAKKGEVVDKLTDDDIFASGFFIPGNIHIVGSMNDIDRSVETFDFALRRRFQWEEINANEIMKDTLISMFVCNPITIGEIDTFVKKVIAMNESMTDSSFNLGQEYHIGPAYFEKYTGDIKSLNKIWDEKIEPTLKEYVRGRNGDKEEFLNDCRIKLGLVLSDDLMKMVDELNEWLKNDDEMKTKLAEWFETNEAGFQYQWFSLSKDKITELNDYIKKEKRDANIKNTIKLAGIVSGNSAIEEKIKEMIEEIFNPKDEDAQED